MDNSVDGIFAEAVAMGAERQKRGWSFFVHKIKRTQNRQLQRVENGCTKWLFRDSCYQPIVHKHQTLNI
ncbi:unknown [92.4 - 45/67 67%] [Pseudomonas synxantha]|nr:unknown [92.4 - 45/67 67%] [Pseudomonas synxantha]